MAAPPSLPPVVKGQRDEFSGGLDILRANGLRPAHDHFLAAGRPPPALNCDADLPGTTAGFDLREGRAMELAPLMEVRRAKPRDDETFGAPNPEPNRAPRPRARTTRPDPIPPARDAIEIPRDDPSRSLRRRRRDRDPSSSHLPPRLLPPDPLPSPIPPSPPRASQTPLPTEPRAIEPIDRARLRAAFAFTPRSPYVLPDEHRGAVPSAIAKARRDAAAATAAAPVAGAGEKGSGAAGGEGVGEREKERKRKREKKDKSERKEKRRRRGGDSADAEPSRSGLSGGPGGTDSAGTRATSGAV
jgi:hypothetical protein